MIVAFHSNQISMQGTEVALFDYAEAAERILGHRAIILHQASNPGNVAQAIERFRERFDVLSYTDRSDLDRQLQKSGADLMYAIKSGRRDGVISRQIPTMVHSVFPTSPFEAHGASFAYISDWLSEGCSNGRIPAVPHIVQLPASQGTLRAQFSIAASDLVIGAMGGSKSFDVPAARQAIPQALEERNDLWYIALNIERFMEHPRAIFLPGTSDLEAKARFIDTCDAMLHARAMGESFGLACGEFSVRNKRVLTYARCKHRHHIGVLGDSALLYDNSTGLVNLIKQLDANALRLGDWDRYSDMYNAERVMKAFDEHLIQPALRRGPVETPGLQLGWQEQFAYLRFKLALKFG